MKIHFEYTFRQKILPIVDPIYWYYQCQLMSINCYKNEGLSNFRFRDMKNFTKLLIWSILQNFCKNEVWGKMLKLKRLCCTFFILLDPIPAHTWNPNTNRIETLIKTLIRQCNARSIPGLCQFCKGGMTEHKFCMCFWKQ